MSANNRYRTANEAIRPGYSPSDLVEEIKKVTLVGGVATIEPDAKTGSLVGYTMLKTGKIVDGEIEVSNAAIGATDEVIVILTYKAQNLQDGAEAFL